jgi:hypothetical protein
MDGLLQEYYVEVSQTLYPTENCPAPLDIVINFEVAPMYQQPETTPYLEERINDGSVGFPLAAFLDLILTARNFWVRRNTPGESFF